MQFYTYNVLWTEMSPFRWNGSHCMLCLIRMRIKIHTAVSMLEQIGTKNRFVFLPGEDMYRTTEGCIERITISAKKTNILIVLSSR